jgi:dihydrofolate reductase
MNSKGGRLSIIVAKSVNDVIGKCGSIPWHIPGELKFFKAITFGHTVIMGRKTFESIGKPLPGRQNWVITRGQNPSNFATKPNETFQIFHSVESVLAAVRSVSSDRHFWIIGGAEIYRQFLPFVDEIICTEIPGSYDGDAFFHIPANFKRAEKLLECPQFVVHRWYPVHNTASGVDG